MPQAIPRSSDANRSTHVARKEDEVKPQDLPAPPTTIEGLQKQTDGSTHAAALQKATDDITTKSIPVMQVNVDAFKADNGKLGNDWSNTLGDIEYKLGVFEEQLGKQLPDVKKAFDGVRQNIATAAKELSDAQASISEPGDAAQKAADKTSALADAQSAFSALLFAALGNTLASAKKQLATASAPDSTPATAWVYLTWAQGQLQVTPDFEFPKDASTYESLLVDTCEKLGEAASDAADANAALAAAKNEIPTLTKNLNSLQQSENQDTLNAVSAIGPPPADEPQ